MCISCCVFDDIENTNKNLFPFQNRVVGDDACYWTTGRIIPVLFTVINILWKLINIKNDQNTQNPLFYFFHNEFIHICNLISNDFYFIFTPLSNCIYHNYAFIKTLTINQQQFSWNQVFFFVLLQIFLLYSVFNSRVNKYPNFKTIWMSH